jgi:hypothetical protein
LGFHGHALWFIDVLKHLHGARVPLMELTLDSMHMSSSYFLHSYIVFYGAIVMIAVTNLFVYPLRGSFQPVSNGVRKGAPFILCFLSLVHC